MIQSSLFAFGLFATFCRALENTNYFTFPAKTDEIPLVHTGDTLNVTWLSDYSQAVMYFWCNNGADLMQTIRDLGGDGSMSVVVNGSWTSPCHWQYCQQANEAIFVDSGHVRVTNERTTPAVTWISTTLGTACGVQSTTITNSAGKTITATVTASTTAAIPSACDSTIVTTSSTTCSAAAAGRTRLSSGGGIGVGIVVGVAISGVTAAIWLLLRRHYLKQSTTGASEMALGEHMMRPKPAEIDHQCRAEMDTEARRGAWALSELPSTPYKRSP